jgi:hypothetical protein
VVGHAEGLAHQPAFLGPARGGGTPQALQMLQPMFTSQHAFDTALTQGDVQDSIQLQQLAHRMHQHQHQQHQHQHQFQHQQQQHLASWGRHSKASNAGSATSNVCSPVQLRQLHPLQHQQQHHHELLGSELLTAINTMAVAPPPGLAQFHARGRAQAPYGLQASLRSCTGAPAPQRSPSRRSGGQQVMLGSSYTGINGSGAGAGASLVAFPARGVGTGSVSATIGWPVLLGQQVGADRAPYRCSVACSAVQRARHACWLPLGAPLDRHRYPPAALPAATSGLRC